MCTNAEEKLEEEEDCDDGNVGAEVPCAAKRAARVRSSWGMKVLSPVRSALLDASSKSLLL